MRVLFLIVICAFPVFAKPMKERLATLEYRIDKVEEIQKQQEHYLGQDLVTHRPRTYKDREENKSKISYLEELRIFDKVFTHSADILNFLILIFGGNYVRRKLKNGEKG